MASRKCLFDTKFGAEYIKSVPACPGVYIIRDETGVVIYVGKAKHLRRRLSQYRNAKRQKKHHKMRAILKAAHAVSVTTCVSDLEAQLLENRLIQEFRPKFNVSGAFSFLYPMIGLLRRERNLYVCYTTHPDQFSHFELRGAYRSRQLTRDAYLALVEILTFIGHREPHQALIEFPRVRFSHLAGFRQIDDRWLGLLENFLEGKSKEFLEEAVMALVEKASARRDAAEVQEWIDELVRFYKFEARLLYRAMTAVGHAGKRVEQNERDRLFINFRELPKPLKRAGASRSF